MNEKKDKKSKKPEYVSKNWKSSQGIRLLAMVLAIVSGFLVGVTSVVTVTLGAASRAKEIARFTPKQNPMDPRQISKSMFPQLSSLPRAW